MLAKHLKLWVMAFAIVFLIVPVIATPSGVWASVKSELLMLQSAFGAATTTRIASTATEAYNAMFVETGMVRGIQRARVTKAEEEQSEEVFGNMSLAMAAVSKNYLDTLSALFYVLTVRVLIFLSWAPFILPFFAGAFCEGVARRKIKYDTFGQYGAVFYASAMHTSIVIAFLPILYLISPFAVTPYFVPFWAVCAALPIITAIANASQIRPK